ncbi:hypothetical protein [Zavarzinella formosa]|uniref:hypothetical protein n=1 Tax=Zavarzinella formosa TaxID=360055 RepID=UPI0002F07502|nr:hypothetical protein [Zavarzinella formosa]
MKKLIMLATVLALFTGSASATEYKKVVTYKTITVCVEKVVSYVVEVIKYDECNRPYKVCVTKYKTIQVEVQKQVPVISYVPACDY